MIRANAQRSFAAGEVSPLLAGRDDFVRFQTGLARARGFLPLVEGPITRAPGTIYDGRTRGDAWARLIEFEFNVDDAVVLEFTPGFMRVWRYGALVMDGGVPYELAIPWNSAAALKRLKLAQAADVIYLVDGVKPIKKLSRFALDNWTIETAEFDGGPLRPWNGDEAVTVSADAASGTVTLTATGGDVFEAGQIGGLFAMRVADWTDVPLWTGNTDVIEGDLMRYDGRVYEVTDVPSGKNTGVNPPVHLSGRALAEKDGITWRYRSTDTGLVRITAVASATEATAKVLDRIPQQLVGGAGTATWAPGAWSDAYGYPAAVAIHDQRLVFAATPTEPRTVWFSAVGLFTDFALGTAADLAFAYTIAAKQGLNRIVWLESGARGLAIGATGEVHASRSTVSAEAVTIENAAFAMVATLGADDAQPVSPDGAPIYISRERGRLYELAYNLADDSVKPRELTLPARHLGADRFEAIAWQSAPLRLGWITRASGELAVMILETAEDVLGWATLPVAGGAVESVSVSPGLDGGDDTVTLVVRREIDGQTRRHVERLAPFFGLLTGAIDIPDANHLFASVVYPPAAPAKSFAGLDHLEGESVLAWTDQGQFGPYLVTDGAVELEAPVGRAVVGLHDDSHSAETFDLFAVSRNGDALGDELALRGLGLRLHRTAAYRARASLRAWGRDHPAGPWVQRTGDGVPGDLRTGWSGADKIDLTTGWANGVRLEFAPLGAAPFTLLSLAPLTETPDPTRPKEGS
ncbi:MAG: hypothetical protein CML43_01025 [Rhodobacteraceae bacterium]|nr:hypothetical protein [Paracoccaceae bacterium]